MRTASVMLALMVAVVLGWATVATAQDAEVEPALTSDAAPETAPDQPAARQLSLQDCIDLALANNYQRPASQYGIQIAEAQHRQALSAHWPSLMLQSSFTRLDQDPTFTFPSTTMHIPGGTITPGPTLVTIPANSFGPGFPPVDVRMPVSSGPIETPAMQFTTPPVVATIMDRDTWDSSVTLTYPIYTGGVIEGTVKQARAGVKAAREDARRTDLAVVRDVKRMYFGALLARELLRVGHEALERLELTLDLTESLYKGGSGRVKKTDYLRNKMVVETLRSLLASTESQEKCARAALVNTMALPWDTQIELTASEIPHEPFAGELPKLVNSAYSFNPDWAKLAAGLDAAAGKLQEAKGATRVKVGLTGSFHYAANSEENGLLGDPTHWVIGIGMNLPIFDGYLGKNQIREAQARLKQLMTRRELLRDGIALQVQAIFLNMSGAEAALAATQAAQEAATENRDLNERAYQDELVETQDVIEAQIMGSLAESRYQLALYELAVAQAELDFVVGGEVQALLAPAE